MTLVRLACCPERADALVPATAALAGSAKVVARTAAPIAAATRVLNESMSYPFLPCWSNKSYSFLLKGIIYA
jgi:hypothetical protein